MDKQALIKPELPGGMNDYSPAQMLAREKMVGTIGAVYRKFGFVPLQTAEIQRYSVLTGQTETGMFPMSLWHTGINAAQVSTSDAARRTALRFDLTVPLARYIAEHMAEHTLPFRRYECGYVFRGEKPQAGRYCAFAQFDADIVGVPVGAADAEIIWCMTEVMRALGFERFIVRISTRHILNALTTRFGIGQDSDACATFLRAIDKLEKVGTERVIDELTEREGAPSALTADQAADLREFLAMSEVYPEPQACLAELKTFFGNCKHAAQGVNELRFIAECLDAAGVDPAHWKIDPTVVRGLGYYTGPVFETTLIDAPEFGSVYSGGRFDDLIARFSGASMPAVGASVGVDRLFSAMETMGLVEPSPSYADVFILSFGDHLINEYFRLAAELRHTGLRTEIGMSHQDMTFKAQLKIALARRASVVLILGDREIREGTILVKDMRRNIQHSIPRGEIVRHMETLLTETR